MNDVQTVLVLNVFNVVLVDVVPGCDTCQDLHLGVLKIGGLHPIGPDHYAQLSRLCFKPFVLTM